MKKAPRRMRSAGNPHVQNKKAPDYYPELLMVTRARIELALQP